MSKRIWAQLRYAAALLATNTKAVFAHRASFWLQAGMMFLNNLIFVTTWFLFFRRFEEIGGWRLPDLLLLYGIVAASFGACMCIFGGIGDLARLVSDGDLDTYLTQPKSTLLGAVCARSVAFGWGDLASSVLLVGFSGYVAWSTLPYILLSVVTGTLIFFATAVLAHSSAFWFGNTRELAHQWLQFTLTFSVYPQTVFGGVVRVLLFTVFPAGFLGYLPVTLVREARLVDLGYLLAGSGAYLVAAWTVFQVGLRRYESGNRISLQV